MSADKMNEVAVLDQYDRGRCPRPIEDDLILRLAESEVADRVGLGPKHLTEPHGQAGGELRIDPDRGHALRRKHRMIDPTNGELQARCNIGGIEIR